MCDRFRGGPFKEFIYKEFRVLRLFLLIGLKLLRTNVFGFSTAVNELRLFTLFIIKLWFGFMGLI